MISLVFTVSCLISYNKIKKWGRFPGSTKVEVDKLTYVSIDGLFNYYFSGSYLLNKNKNFKLFCVDMGSNSAFGNKVIELKNEIEEMQNENYFGVLTAPSSIFLPEKFKRREYIAEAKKNIFYT